MMVQIIMSFIGLMILAVLSFYAGVLYSTIKFRKALEQMTKKIQEEIRLKSTEKGDI